MLNKEELIIDLIEISDFSDASIGVVSYGEGQQGFVYDKNKCIELLIKSGIDNYEDAKEFLEQNTMRAYQGEGAPLFIDLF